jgi:predicted deacylase
MDILEKVDNFYFSFKGEKIVVGKSAKNRNVYMFTVKKTDFPKIFVQYAIHGREYITSYLALKQISHFIKRGKRGTVYFIPISNPDGVYISLYQNPLNKANANGVDLNVNFDADWGKGEKNVFTRGSENFVGDYPFCEIESRILRDITLKINPDITISYHSKGEEIYFNFNQPQKDFKRDIILANQISKVTGYKIVNLTGSSGGYKDWCIKTLKIPAFTIEVGSDDLIHPIKEKHIKSIYQKNKKVICTLTEFYDRKIYENCD